MTIPKAILIIIILTLSHYSCSPSIKTSFSISKHNIDEAPIQISLIELAKTFKKYEGHYIETMGRFYSTAENFSICAYVDSLNRPMGRFWLDIDRHLKINQKSIDMMNGKLIKVRGVIDTTYLGHMNGYRATIRAINFWQLQ